MKSHGSQKVLKGAAVAVLLVLALVSFRLSAPLSSPDTFRGTIAALDEKKTTVMELAAASTAASAAITLIPGDTATPIANELAELSSYFLLVVCAIYLEKYLVTITGIAAFRVLLPAACALTAASIPLKSAACRRLAARLAAFGLALFCVIPASVWMSDKIETTYEASIQSTIESAKQATDTIEAGAEAEDENTGVLSGLFSGLKNGVSSAVTKVEDILNRFIEALAVMIITSCVIPILVLVFFVWLVKLALGLDLGSPALPKKSGKGSQEIPDKTL